MPIHAARDNRKQDIPAQQGPESPAGTTPEEQQRELRSSGYAEPEIIPASTNMEENSGENQVEETNTGNVNLFPLRRSSRIPTAHVRLIPGAIKYV